MSTRGSGRTRNSLSVAVHALHLRDSFFNALHGSLRWSMCVPISRFFGVDVDFQNLVYVRHCHAFQLALRRVDNKRAERRACTTPTRLQGLSAYPHVREFPLVSVRRANPFSP